jgi:hypothetical protein
VRDRLVTALGALGALAIVYALFFQPPGEPPVTRPLSTEPGRNGYLGLRSWLEREGVRVVSLQERYDRLLADDSAFEPDGNVLITTMPHRTPVRVNELSELNYWVASGNTLLLLAALDDTPEWSSYGSTTNFLRDLGWMTSLNVTTATDEAEDGSPLPPRIPPETSIEFHPAANHPLMAGVEALVGFSDGSSSIWSATGSSSDDLLLRLAVESTTQRDAVWQMPRGAGQVILAASGSFLSNENLASGDAPQLIANLLRYHLGTGGAVVFDDMHQGLSSLYDSGAFYRDPRLHRTVLLLLAGWLIYILGSSNRLASPVEMPPEPRQGDFLVAAGGFMARRLDRRAAGLRLMNEWFEGLRQRRGLPPLAEPPWAELEATPALGERTHRALRRCHAQLARGRRVDLVYLHNLLRQAREAIG